MFGGLKNKFKGFFKKEEEVLEKKLLEEQPEVVEEQPEEPIEEPAPEPKVIEPVIEEPEPAKEEKKKFIPKLTLGTKLKKTITRKATIKAEDVEALLWDFNLELLEADVSVVVAEKITESIKQNLIGKEISSKQNIQQLTTDSIKQSLDEILIEPDFVFIDKIRKKKPYVILFLGPNGQGKSTSIGKVAHYLKQNNISTVIAAADTFRAAAIEQIEKIGLKAGVRVIKQQYGSDPAAVCYDAISHAKSKGVDVVLIDTAGRSELNKNLMEEMKKVVRVANPDMKIYIGEALAGNAAVEEAKKFNEFIDIDGIIMTKTDCDVKGGSILSISYEIQKPIIFLGLGQELVDLQPFKKQWFIDKVFE